jgi:hypothetical protein
MVIWSILLPFGTFLGSFGIFSRFVMLYQEKSGNPNRGNHFIAKLSFLWPFCTSVFISFGLNKIMSQKSEMLAKAFRKTS